MLWSKPARLGTQKGSSSFDASSKSGSESSESEDDDSESLDDDADASRPAATESSEMSWTLPSRSAFAFARRARSSYATRLGAKRGTPEAAFQCKNARPGAVEVAEGADIKAGAGFSAE